MVIPPKPASRARLTCGGLLLTLFAASGAAAPLPVPPDTPAAYRTAGPARQGDFTLLAVTRGGSPYGRVSRTRAVPPAVPAPPGPVPSFQTVTPAEGATGLWIAVRGGIGFRTLAVPDGRGRHVYPLGPAALVVDETGPRGTSFGWNGPDGVSRIAEGVSPYGFEVSWAAALPGHPSGDRVTLIPIHLADRFTIAAQPLDAAGRALSRPVSLVCQSVTPDVLFAQFPASYSAATRQFRVTASRCGAGPTAAWRLAGLPPVTRNGPDRPPPAVAAAFGALTIRAAAAEAEDVTGYPGGWNRHPPRDAKPLARTSSEDSHPWTGVPSIRLLLAAHNASPIGRDQSWVVEIERITPQWGPAATFPRTPEGRPRESFPVYYHGNDGPTTAYPFASLDWEVGAGWPGQQQWVKIDGAALRSAWRTETVTLHDAALVHDAGFGGDRIVWQHIETETTASGISVTALNGRPGVPDVGIVMPGASAARYDHGWAEMLLAWHLPVGLASEEHAFFNDLRVANPPHAIGALASEMEWSSAPLWDALAAPGAADAGALKAAEYAPLRFSVRSTAPGPLPPLSVRRSGFYALEPAPWPPLIKTLTFQISIREEQERHPFHLWVPIRPAFPPGWDADAADSRSPDKP